ncbi:hypothetical protein AB0J21_21655 [Streptomyces sp. NPDC049954]|uniref:hypothetical protein n=1 Tax=Streptomyces sp. NPDC049954 TaxID=3155779 RepID=UPI0034390345
MTRLGWVSRPGGAARGHRAVLTESGRAVFAEVTAAGELALTALTALTALAPERRVTLDATFPAFDRLHETRHAGWAGIAEPGR